MAPQEACLQLATPLLRSANAKRAGALVEFLVSFLLTPRGSYMSITIHTNKHQKNSLNPSKIMYTCNV